MALCTYACMQIGPRDAEEGVLATRSCTCHTAQRPPRRRCDSCDSLAGKAGRLAHRSHQRGLPKGPQLPLSPPAQRLTRATARPTAPVMLPPAVAAANPVPSWWRLGPLTAWRWELTARDKGSEERGAGGGFGGCSVPGVTVDGTKPAATTCRRGAVDLRATVGPVFLSLTATRIGVPTLLGHEITLY